MIIDASVAFKLLVEEEGSEAAAAYAVAGDLQAPILLLSEVANALWKAIQRGQILGEGAPERLTSLPSLLSMLDETSLMMRALEISVELAHPVYDCVYLAVAEDLDTQLLTADQRLLRKLAGTAWRPRLKELL
jgi:predicted nucleic acid-binding protein